jgi:effector-binding domain-containing protein
MGHDAAIDARIVERVPQQTAAVRFREPMATVDVGALMDRAMGALGARLGEAGVNPAGPPYARYHEWGGEWADVEIGFPLAERLPGPALTDVSSGEVGASALPGGRVAAAIHQGPYPELGKTYGRLHDWIHAQGEEDGPGPWESYLDSPEEVTDTAALRTEVLWPVAEQ